MILPVFASSSPQNLSELTKLLRPEAFTDMLYLHEGPAERAPTYAWNFPLLETGLVANLQWSYPLEQ